MLPLLIAAARPHGWSSIHLDFRLSPQPILALVAGLLILIQPKRLNFIVAAYLIIVGLMGVLHVRW